MADKPDPAQDGVSHVNCWSKGKTELGRLLSNFAHTPFKHPQRGHFASMEAYWYFCATGCTNDHLRRLYGASAKSAGLLCDNVPVDEDDFHEMIREGIRCKIYQTPRIIELLMSCDLPFEHYYVYGNKNDVVVNKSEHRWQLDTIDDVRNELRGVKVYKQDEDAPAVVLPSSSMIMLVDGTYKTASELQVGDEIAEPSDAHIDSTTMTLRQAAPPIEPPITGDDIPF